MTGTGSTRTTGNSPNDADPADVVSKVRALLETRYVFPDIAAAVSGVLTEGLAVGRYPADAEMSCPERSYAKEFPAEGPEGSGKPL